MSTPFVGLKQVFEVPVFEHEGMMSGTESMMSESIREHRRMMKRRLVYLLEGHYGVQGIQVGTLQMKLSEEVPERHLIQAAVYLLEQLRQESTSSRAVEMIAECLQVLVPAWA